jgi:hypothetical protein
MARRAKGLAIGWHRVQSLRSFNVLVNYWWADGKPLTSPLDSLLHGLLALRDLPATERAVWRNLFDYYVFQTSGDPLAHLPPAMRGLMGAHSPEQLREIKALLARALSRPCHNQPARPRKESDDGFDT